MIWIRKISIEPDIVRKIREKHGVSMHEVYDVLNDQNSRFQRSQDKYGVIGLSRTRYVAVFFRYDSREKNADVRSARPATDKEIQAYKSWRR